MKQNSIWGWVALSVVAIVAISLVVKLARKRRLINANAALVDKENLANPKQYYTNIASAAYTYLRGCRGTLTGYASCDDDAAEQQILILWKLNDDELRTVANEFYRIYKGPLRAAVTTYSFWIGNKPAEKDKLEQRMAELGL